MTETKLTTDKVYAIQPDQYGWRVLPDGRRVWLGDKVQVADSAWDHIGTLVRIGSGAIIGTGVIIDPGATIGDDVRIGYGVRIGDVRIGYGVRIGDDVRIGYGVGIGVRASIGDGVRIASGVRIGDGAIIANGAIIETSRAVITIDFIGSRTATLTAVLSADPIAISTGCRHGMPIDEFESEVNYHHGANRHGREYRATLAYLRELKAIRFPDAEPPEAAAVDEGG